MVLTGGSPVAKNHVDRSVSRPACRQSAGAGAMTTLVSHDMFPLLPVLLIAGRELVIAAPGIGRLKRCERSRVKDCEIRRLCSS